MWDDVSKLYLNGNYCQSNKNAENLDSFLGVILMAMLQQNLFENKLFLCGIGSV